MSQATEQVPVPDAAEFDLRLTLTELNTILGALGVQPYNQVAGVVYRIAEQTVPQFTEHQRRAALSAVPAATETRQ